MDNYYKFPWQMREGTYQNGDKRLSLLSWNGGFIADVHRQTAHSNEDDWKAIATLLAMSPELLAVTKAVAEGKVTDEIKESAEYLMELLVIEESEGFDYWREIDKLIEEDR